MQESELIKETGLISGSTCNIWAFSFCQIYRCRNVDVRNWSSDLNFYSSQSQCTNCIRFTYTCQSLRHWSIYLQQWNYMITWLCKCCDLDRTEFTHCDTGYWTKYQKQEALRDHRPPPTPTRLVFPLPKNVAWFERLHRHANIMLCIVSSPNCPLSWELWCEVIIN